MADAITREMTPEEFLATFPGLLGEHTSYRLETLDEYRDPSEEEALRLFLNHGGPVQRTQWWYEHVRKSLRDGKVMARVHVVSEPLSDYVRFEVAAYLVNGVAAGEDIRILPRRHAKTLDLAPFDYWLMDSKIAYVLSYDDTGVMTQVKETTDAGTISACCRWRDVAMRAAVPVRDYLSTRKEAGC